MSKRNVRRRTAGQRHEKALCLALFTLAIVAGNRGFLAIGDWLTAYKNELISLFALEKKRLPSYSTIRRVLLQTNYQEYSERLARFFEVQPLPGEMLAVDGKVLRGSYQLETDNPHSEAHPAIRLVTAYIVERKLIGGWQQYQTPQYLHLLIGQMCRLRIERNYS
ncbi:MAG TPA: transposase family protein [Nostocaceae cyanobacterium]|nr:transposase family protein [Nostocaceae cyanobacterium]